jgi:hypothetical protein
MTLKLPIPARCAAFHSMSSCANRLFMTEPKPTHTAYALRRESRAISRYIEIGNSDLRARCPHCATEVPVGPQRVYLDRLPIGGFSGDVYLSPVGEQPPNPKPERPGEDNP